MDQKETRPTTQKPFEMKNIDSGFVGVGIMAGLVVRSVNSPVSFLCAAALPALGGQNNEQKTALFTGEVIGYMLPSFIPTIAQGVLAFAVANPGLTLASAAAGAIYLKQDAIIHSAKDYAHTAYDSSFGEIGRMYDHAIESVGKVFHDYFPA